MYNSRAQETERLIEDLRRRMARVEGRVTLVGQSTAMVWQNNGGGGGSGGGSQGFIGKAAVDINARTGATLAATGQVDVYHDVSGTLTAVGTNVLARCSVSRTTVAGHGIDSGGWCWVEQDPFGTYWASPLDCT